MYDYNAEKQKLFTEENQRLFLGIRDRAQSLAKQAGVATMGMLISKATGDTWLAMACVDRLVELGELREVHLASTPAAQHRIFTLNCR